MQRTRLRDLPYLPKWIILSIIIGVVVGLTISLFFFTVSSVLGSVFGKIIGLSIPNSYSEGGTISYHYTPDAKIWLIPIIAAIGGLIVGLIRHSFEPDEGYGGTGSAISAFHNDNGEIKKRSTVIRFIASVITIGTGGSAGNEGPSSAIGAGIGSSIGEFLGLNAEERRTALVIGIGAGLGAVFKAPFGGAIFGTEVLYKNDFEANAILPSFIATAISYTIFCSFFGFAPILGRYSGVINLTTLIFFGILGLLTGLYAVMYYKSSHYISDKFRKLKIRRFLKPALGGLIAGLIFIMFPETIAIGYGWLQIFVNQQLNLIPTFGLPLLMVLFMLPLAKILATGLTLGSGGSGGEFAPGIFIGGSLGALFGTSMHIMFPVLVPSITPFVIIGMLSLFGAAGKTPIAVMIMVIEMTGSLTLLAAAMIATFIAYFISGSGSLYKSQVENREVSPAHEIEHLKPLLKDAMRYSISESLIIKDGLDVNATTDQGIDFMKKYKLNSIPVTSTGKFVGVLSYKKVNGSIRKSIMKNMTPIRQTSNIDNLMSSMHKNNSRWMPIVEENGKYVGFVKLSDVIAKYKVQINDLGNDVIDLDWVS
ncbi:MAG: chloride channel protein [Candidatus Micrarchaeota archaeon]|nr:chloride channel protein [Candidatus Micrarchaeota archaeon]